ncbi:MAG: DUF4365 domain-containing protein [Chryseobacterium sp.]|nr:MAG: DUF4365 domain-containing protein [Chryseobacterium sp.]
MDNKRLRGHRAAPFPKSSQSEQDSADIFHSLIDRRFIRGNISVMDKMPNSDGVLNFIDEQQYTIGVFEVQLKTLSRRYKTKPRFQCELTLLAYALDSILPMILAVVEQESRLVYWLYLDEALVATLNPKANSKSVMLPLSASQVIDGNDLNYISAWKNIINTVKYKLSHFDQIEQQRNAFRMLLKGGSNRLVPAYSLNALAIREIHIFLDLLNSKLDHEFSSIKEMLYYHYWKLAIAISVYEADDLAFLILPIPLSSNSPLILEVADPTKPFLDELFERDKALIMMQSVNNPIKENPQMLALELINNEVFKVVGKKNFPTADRFLAEEYIYGFGTRFSSVLGVARFPDQVNIQHVLRTIFVLVPLSRDIMHGPSTEQITYLIDHLMTSRDVEYKTMIEKADQALRNGMTANPNLRLSMRTGLFDLDLLRYYLEYLDSLGVKNFDRPLLEMQNGHNNGPYMWSNWNLDNIYSNVEKVFNQFPRIYGQIVQERFPLLKAELDLFQKDSIIIYILAPHYQGDKPQLLCYRFLAVDSFPLRKLLFFHADDSECPEILNDDDRQNMWTRSFVFFGVPHELSAGSGLPIELFMGSSPLHRLVNDTLGGYLDKYFKVQGLKKTDYKGLSAYE